MDAAMQTDFASADLFPKSGKELTFTVNGKTRFVRGDMGDAAAGVEQDLAGQLLGADMVKGHETPPVWF